MSIKSLSIKNVHILLKKIRIIKTNALSCPQSLKKLFSCKEQAAESCSPRPKHSKFGICLSTKIVSLSSVMTIALQV